MKLSSCAALRPVLVLVAAGLALSACLPASRADDTPGGLICVRDDNLWSLDADGQHPQRLTTSADCSAPSCAPDGSRIVYVRSGGYRQKSLWIYEVDQRTAAQFLGAVSEYACPRWSPDGKSIACFRLDAAHPATVDNDNYELVRIEIATKAVTPLAAPLVGPSGLAWSPDSQQLASATSVESEARISLLSAVAGEVVNAELTTLKLEAQDVAIRTLNWVPSGKIVYTTDVTRDEKREMEVCAVGLDGHVQALCRQTGGADTPPSGVCVDRAGQGFLCWQSTVWLLTDQVKKLAENVSEVTCR
jgi:hypothetical protein